MPLPAFFPRPIYVKSLDEEGCVTLRELCQKARTPCRATGHWTTRKVKVIPGKEWKIWATPGMRGVVHVQVPGKTELTLARNALGAMAYSTIQDLVAKASINPETWARISRRGFNLYALNQQKKRDKLLIKR